MGGIFERTPERTPDSGLLERLERIERRLDDEQRDRAAIFGLLSSLVRASAENAQAQTTMLSLHADRARQFDALQDRYVTTALCVQLIADQLKELSQDLRKAEGRALEAERLAYEQRPMVILPGSMHAE